MRSLLAAVTLTAVLQGPTLATLLPGIERAALIGDTAALERSREQLRALTDSQTDAALAIERYTLAYVDWRLAYLYSSHQKLKKQARLDEARELLEGLTRNDSTNAEAHALLGSVYGGLIDLNAWKAMTLGPKASDALATAAAAAPNNPRVALLSGMNAVYTPKLFGGGLDVAEPHLRRADALFAQSSEAAWPYWGKLDALAWLGQVLQKKGDRDGARAMYDRALSMAPDYAWVKVMLLPSLSRAPKRR